MVRLKCALPGLSQFLTTESPLKIMKNAFYFTFLFVRYLHFCLQLFGHVANNKKAKVNFKIQLLGNKIIIVHILPKISGRKCKETMKFGLLVE